MTDDDVDAMFRSPAGRKMLGEFLESCAYRPFVPDPAEPAADPEAERREEEVETVKRRMAQVPTVVGLDPGIVLSPTVIIAAARVRHGVSTELTELLLDPENPLSKLPHRERVLVEMAAALLNYREFIARADSLRDNPQPPPGPQPPKPPSMG